MTPRRGDPRGIDVEIDGEEYPIDGREHTVRELLILSGSDPESTYLIELRGDQEIKHENLDELLKLHEHMRFVSGDRGPAPVA